jgi:hypothetical protein
MSAMSHGKATILIGLMVLAMACGKQSADNAAGSGTATPTAGSNAGSGNVAGSNGGSGTGSASNTAGSAGSGSAAAGAGSGSTGNGSNIASGQLPRECQQWKDALERLAKCDQMPEAAKKSLRQAYDTAAAAWLSLPAEDRAHLAGSCQAGANAILESAKLTCGW